MLGYNFYDTEAIENTAQEIGFLEDVKEIDEKATSLFLRFFSQEPEVPLEGIKSIDNQIQVAGVSGYG